MLHNVFAKTTKCACETQMPQVLLANGPQREKTCLWGFVNIKGADQPAHPRRLISAFVIR